MEPITIRRAAKEDIETLLRFEQGVITAERPFDSTLKEDPISYYDIAEMITAPHIEIVVAQAGNTIVGSGYARIESVEQYLAHEKHAYLGFMYVDPLYRGKGINLQIIEALKAWALTQNITEMRLQVYHDNLPAIKAYEKAGFSKYMIIMRMGIK
jgi:ribosomal protein S18 acetylase RimI-like enzyme